MSRVHDALRRAEQAGLLSPPSARPRPEGSGAVSAVLDPGPSIDTSTTRNPSSGARTGILSSSGCVAAGLISAENADERDHLARIAAKVMGQRFGPLAVGSDAPIGRSLPTQL